MPRSASRPDKPKPAARKTGKATAAKPPQRSAVARMVLDNPVTTAGATGFAVALAYVSANALWYQPNVHHGAFFATRDFVRVEDRAPPEPETTFMIERPAVPPARTAAPAVQPDRTLAEVQRVLKSLGFYSGSVDGIAGNGTAAAIRAYRTKVGLPAGEGVNAALLDQLGLEAPTSAIRPSPKPRPDTAGGADQADTIRAVQAGLKAFGNDGISVDGVAGGRTRAAIKEFQGIFGLQQTGEPSAEVLAKMREIGLTD